MRRYRVELIKEFEFPADLEFLSSPIGIFCREIHHKKWLEADEGSVGHQLITDFVQALNVKELIVASLYEIDLIAEFKEEIEQREFEQDQKLQSELRKATSAPKLPKYSAYRTVNGQRQGLSGFRWIDIPTDK